MKKLTDFQAGYVSAQTDGEGYLGLIPKGRYIPIVDITSTDEYTIDWLVKVLEAQKVPNRTKHKPAWHCRLVSAEKVSEFLLKVQLLTKRVHQRLLIEACSMLLLGPYDKSRMMEIYAKLRELNKR